MEFSSAQHSITDAARQNTSSGRWQNTIEEKRRMRNKRKKRKRAKKTSLAKSLQDDLKKAQEDCEKNALLYKNMSRCYRDRWHWELMKRREAMKHLKHTQFGEDVSTTTSSAIPSTHEIRQDLLIDPIIEGKPIEHYISRGSFSVVRLQIYRGIKVAVKEMLPKTVKDDVHREAAILSQLCHPYLPCFFGVITTQRPFKVITQFQGIDNEAVTMSQEIGLHKIGITSSKTWVSFCAVI